VRRIIKLVLLFVFLGIFSIGCSSESKYEQDNDSFKILENNISTGTAATYFTTLKKSKEIESLGNVYEMQSEKGKANVSILENNDDVIEIDVTIYDVKSKNKGDWATIVQVFALGLSGDITMVTEKTTHDEIIEDVSNFLADNLNEVFDSIDINNGEKSNYKVDNIGDRRIVYTVSLSGNSISFNYLIDNRKLYEN
jgi:hypothetical protein